MGRRRPKTDGEGEVGKAHKSLDDQKEGTVTKNQHGKGTSPSPQKKHETKTKDPN